MTKSEYQERFEALTNLFNRIHLNFYVWKGLQVKAFEETYAKNNHFWSAVLVALENGWLTELAKIYENSSFSKTSKVISVFALLPYQTDVKRAAKVQRILDSNSDIINNVQRLRDHQLAHNNAKHLSEPKVILNKFPIKYAKVEELLSLSGEILSNLNPKMGHGYAYELLNESSEKDGKLVVEKLKTYTELHKKHLDEFVKGKIKSPQFPPV